MKIAATFILVVFSAISGAEVKFSMRDFSFGSVLMPSEPPNTIVVSPSSGIVSMGISGKYNFVLNVNSETYLCNVMEPLEKDLVFRGKPCNYKQLYLLDAPSKDSKEYKLYKKFKFVLSSVFYFWPQERHVKADNNIETIIEEDRLTSILRVDKSKGNKRIIYKSVLDDEHKRVDQEIRVEGTNVLNLLQQEIVAEHDWLGQLIEGVMEGKLDISTFKRLCEQNNIQCLLMAEDDIALIHKRNE